jgi:hypothetical protein
MSKEIGENKKTDELTTEELDAASGGTISHVNDIGYKGPKGTMAGKNVGEGDTIDTNMDANNNLPGKGMWGN